MNLYYAVTNYHLLCCILHSIIYHPNEHNILYLSSWHPDFKELLKNLEQSKLFNRVEIFEEVTFPSGNQKISNKQIEKDISWILDKIPLNFIDDAERCNEIYIAGDHYCCSLYLIAHRIPYNYLEEACGVLSDEERLMKIIRNIDYSRFQIMKKLKLPGNHHYIIHRYGDFNHQLPGYFNKKDLHFSVSESLKLLNEKQIYKIIKVFSTDDFIIPEDVTLLLTFHYVNMNLLSMDDQRLLYSLLLDYFFDSKNLIIKQHPSDIQPNYAEWFPNSVILPRKLPSELLPVLSKNKFSRALTSYSTSVFSLKEYCKDVISFQANIEKTFKSINQYYFLLKILNILNIEDYKLVGFGIDESIIKQLVYQYNLKNITVHCMDEFNQLNLEEKKIILLDKFNVKEFSNCWSSIVGENDIVIYLNFEKLLLLIECCEKFDYSQIYTAFLEKEVINKHKYFNKDILDTEIICFYGLSYQLIEQAIKIRENKVLENCNIKISLCFGTFKNYVNVYKKNKQLEEEIVQSINQNQLLTEKNNVLKQEFDKLEIDYGTKIKENEDMKSQFICYKKLYDDIIHSSSWRITSGYRKIGAILKRILKKIKGSDEEKKG